LNEVTTFPWPQERQVPRIGLVIGRWDRPLRAMEFAGCMRPELVDAIIVAGGPVFALRRELIHAGWPADRVMAAVHFNSSARMLAHRLTHLSRAINPDAREVVVIGIENTHDPFANYVRKFFRAGTQRSLVWEL
jgi:hypothetical protein